LASDPVAVAISRAEDRFGNVSIATGSGGIYDRIDEVALHGASISQSALGASACSPPSVSSTGRASHMPPFMVTMERIPRGYRKDNPVDHTERPSTSPEQVLQLP
jgi:hypothetical protein